MVISLIVICLMVHLLTFFLLQALFLPTTTASLALCLISQIAIPASIWNQGCGLEKVLFGTQCTVYVSFISSSVWAWTGKQNLKLEDSLSMKYFVAHISYSLAKSAAWKFGWLRRRRKGRGNQVRLLLHQLFLNHDMLMLWRQMAYCKTEKNQIKTRTALC